MANLIDHRLPKEIEQDAQFTRRRRSEVVTMANGFEEISTPQADSRRIFSFSYGPRNIEAIKALRDAWEVCLGKVYAFRFRDWTNYRTAPGATAISATDQALGLGDGAQVLFQMQETVSFGPRSYTRRIQAIVAGSLVVAVNGVQLAPAGFSVDLQTGEITLAAAPGAALAVTAGCEFDVWVRFDSDETTMENLIYAEADEDLQISRSAKITLIERFM